MINYKKSAEVLRYFCRSCVNKWELINEDPCKSCLNKGIQVGLNYKPLNYKEIGKK